MRKLPMSMVMAGLLFVGTACEDDESGSTAESVAESASGNSAPVAFTGDVAECLQGTWVQNAGHLQEFLSAVGGPLVFVVMPDSLLTMVLAGDAVNVTSTITLQASIAETVMQTTGNGSYAGTFAADGSTLDVTFTSQEFETGDWMVTVDGETATAPGMAPVEIGAPVGGPGTYTCSDSTLVVVASGRTSTFERA